MQPLLCVTAQCLHHCISTALQHVALTTSNSSCPVAQSVRPHPGDEGARVLLAQHLIATSYKGCPTPQEGILHRAAGMLLLLGMWFLGSWLLHAHLPHLASVPPHPITPATPLTALTAAAPKAMACVTILRFRRQKPLTPEHQCPQAAGPVSLSRPQGLDNGPRSPALQK